MRYEFVGHTTPFVGKTLWEIVGNLKNFGVGRLIKKSEPKPHPELSFMKVIKVQPFPPKQKLGENRRVMVWVDEIFKGCKFPNTLYFKDTDIAKYTLIPKLEEEKYLSEAAKLTTPEKRIDKYTAWPPLYKKLWEENNEAHGPIPKLLTQPDDFPGYNIIYEETTYEQPEVSFYAGKLTVAEMYQEIVRLKKIIKTHKAFQK